MTGFLDPTSLHQNHPKIPERRVKCQAQIAARRNSSYPVLTLPLDLVQEVEIALVELVDTHVSVLTTAAVALSGGISSHCVERAEMATDTANLLFENLVVEARLELSLPCRGCCDIHSCLSTAEDDEILLDGHRGAVERGVSDVGLENLEVLGRDELEVC